MKENEKNSPLEFLSGEMVDTKPTEFGRKERRGDNISVTEEIGDWKWRRFGANFPDQKFFTIFKIGDNLLSSRTASSPP
jgi:hypothetical protein